MQDNPKLVVVTREDLSPGYQAVQSAHAAIDFIFEHPSRAGPWHTNSNYLVLLAVEDEKALKGLIRTLSNHPIDYTVFREPDIGNEITAVAIEPSVITQKLVRRLPLLFKDKVLSNAKATENSLQVLSN